jgi:hypothetical protein
MFSVYVCAFFCVCVQVEALRWADHQSKESYRLSMIRKLRKLSPMLQSGSKLPSVGATRKKKTTTTTTTTIMCWASVVGIATGYGLDGRGVGLQVPVGSRIFFSPRRPDRLWGHPTSYLMSTRGSFPCAKAAGAWSWPLTSNSYRGQENVDLYIHSPIRLHGVVLN